VLTDLNLPNVGVSNKHSVTADSFIGNGTYFECDIGKVIPNYFDFVTHLYLTGKCLGIGCGQRPHCGASGSKRDQNQINDELVDR